MIDMLMLISDALAKCDRLYTSTLQEKDLEEKAGDAAKISLLMDLLLPYGTIRFQESSQMFIMDIAEAHLEREHENIVVTGTVAANGYDIHMTRESK